MPSRHGTCGPLSAGILSVCTQVLRAAGIRFERFSVIEMNRSSQDYTFLTLLVFIDGKPMPSFLIKATPDPDRGRIVETEYRNLSHLHRWGGSELRRSVPRPVYYGEVDGTFVFAEAAAPGVRMKNLPPERYFTSRRFRGDLDAVVGWLLAFHVSGSNDEPLPPAESDRAAAAIAEYRAGFHVSGALDRLLDETERSLDGTSLPWGPWHGDFCTANILVEGDEIHVIDWEHTLRRSWPLAELLHFLTSVWCVPYRKGQAAIEDNYRCLFFKRNPLEQPVRRALERYATGLDLDRNSLLPLSAIAWVVHANRKRRRFPDATDSHRPLVMFRDGRCLNLELLAELRDDFLPARLASNAPK